MACKVRSFPVLLGFLALSVAELTLPLSHSLYAGGEIVLMGLPMLERTVVVWHWLISTGFVLGKERMGRVVNFVDGLPTETHKAIAYTIGALSGICLAILKARQHFVFQTSAYDLGLQASVAWNTTHGRPFFDSIQNINYLGDHFSPIHLALALAYRLWEEAVTLLVIQSIGIGLGATALYLLTLKRLRHTWPAIALTLLFLFNPYLHKVSVYDFHPIAFAIPLFLWMLYFIECERYIPVAALALIAVTVEETLLPPLVGVGIYISLFHKRFRVIGLMLATLGVIYFILALKIWMPFFLKEDRLTHIGRYANLGGSTLNEIMYALLRNPLIFFRAMVVPFEKVTSVVSLFLSVGFLPLLAPRQLILLVLPLSMLVVSNYQPQWTFSYQYSSAILPFLFFGSAYGVQQLEHLLQRFSLMRGSLRSSAMTSWVGLPLMLLIGFNLYRLPSYTKPWSKAHVDAIYSLMNKVPPTASVCANQHFVPHLINRPHVSMFRIGGHAIFNGQRAEYVLLEPESNDPWLTWPSSVEDYRQAVAIMLDSKLYAVVEERDGVVLLKARPEAAGDGH